MPNKKFLLYRFFFLKGKWYGCSSNKDRCNFYLSFDELLELSHQGNNRVIDMLVGDIYGGMDYAKVCNFLIDKYLF